MTTLSRIPERLRPRVWWWIAAAVLAHLLAWTAWFTIAAHHPVADVPLASVGGH